MFQVCLPFLPPEGPGEEESQGGHHHDGGPVHVLEKGMGEKDFIMKSPSTTRHHDEDEFSLELMGPSFLGQAVTLSAVLDVGPLRFEEEDHNEPDEENMSRPREACNS